MCDVVDGMASLEGTGGAVAGVDGLGALPDGGGSVRPADGDSGGWRVAALTMERQRDAARAEVAALTARAERAEAEVRHLADEWAIIPSEPAGEVESGKTVIDAAHIERQRQWSTRTFGPGARLLGVLDHIRKELREIEAAPGDVEEWVDVLILAFDGAWRAGWEPQQILDAIVAKQTKNEGRSWPDWRGRSEDEAIEHVRDDDPGCTVCGRDNRNGTHMALEMTGHLSHPFTPAPASPEAERWEPASWCRHPACRDTNWCGTGRVHMRGPGCPPDPAGKHLGWRPEDGPLAPAPVSSGGQADGEGAVGCTCQHYVVDYSDPERYHDENVDREDDPNCPVHGRGQADDEVLGRIVREAWVEWAREQPDPKPGWLVGWDDLDDGQREVDVRIARAVLAARPVLSREALAKVLTDHRYLCRSARGVSPRWEQCACGERFTGTEPWRMLARHQADHLADVLTAGGEQRG